MSKKADTVTSEERVARIVANVAKAEIRFAESIVDDIMDRYVDPREEFEGWTPLDAGLSAAWGTPYVLPYRNEMDLAGLRNESRQLVNQNEFAINAVENRISYVAGTGHEYSVNAKSDAELPEKLADDVKAEIDDFIKRNKWAARQQEIIRRRDRDGECFLRFFDGPDGPLVRFVEPEDVASPLNAEQTPGQAFGIRFADGDMETPVAYHVRGEWVDAAEIQHRKANVDMADPRGVPTFYPVRKNLTRAAKLLRNMSTTAEIQAAIAMIRRHAKASAEKIQQVVTDNADSTKTTSTRTKTYKEYPPGSIIDTNADSEWQFPAAGIDISKFVAGIQAELRAVASRLVMPEFMLSSDASNANYSSTLVAEGPSVKMFERMQAEMIEQDREVLERAVQSAIAAGRLPINTLEMVEIDAEPPNVTSRDRMKEVQADAMLVDKRVMSRETMAARHGLDYESEREKIEGEADASAAMYGLPMFPGMLPGGSSPFGNQGNQDGGNQDGDNRRVREPAAGQAGNDSQGSQDGNR